MGEALTIAARNDIGVTINGTVTITGIEEDEQFVMRGLKIQREYGHIDALVLTNPTGPIWIERCKVVSPDVSPFPLAPSIPNFRTSVQVTPCADVHFVRCRFEGFPGYPSPLVIPPYHSSSALMWNAYGPADSLTLHDCYLEGGDGSSMEPFTVGTQGGWYLRHQYSTPQSGPVEIYGLAYSVGTLPGAHFVWPPVTCSGDCTTIGAGAICIDATTGFSGLQVQGALPLNPTNNQLGEALDTFTLNTIPQPFVLFVPSFYAPTDLSLETFGTPSALVLLPAGS